MKTLSVKQRLLRSTIIGGAAIAAAFALPAVAVLATPTIASAQDYTTGALSGTVSDQAGAPVSGASVTIRSNEQGFTRSFTTGANGQFRASLIPPGTYEVTINAQGFDALIEPGVAVQVNSNNGYVFTVGAAGADEASDLGDVVVVGVRPELDFSQNATGLTVNIDELVERVPIGRNVASVALLAPRAIEGDSVFGETLAQGGAGQPSLGGSSVAENAFYVNGLNITNFNTYVGAATLPFEFYRTVDVQTGGYSAEFGRATGGIINAVTKSGTNEWIFELHGNWSPDELREDAPIIWNRARVASSTTTAGSVTPASAFTRNDLTEQDSWSLIAEAGGPIISDRLYAYGLYQWSELDTLTVNNTGAQNTQTIIDIPIWGAKVDAYLTDTQRLELTYWTNEGSYDAVVTQRADGSFFSRQTTETGGNNYVVRYTGNMTDWLTLSAAYGVSEQQNNTIPLSKTTVNAVDSRGAAFRVPGSNAFATYGSQSTEREFYRADADITFSAFGDHHVRMGIDQETTTLKRSAFRTGGYNLNYQSAANLTFGEAGTTVISAATGNIGLGGAAISGSNEAWYIQDSWDINDNLNIQVGLRHDLFSLSNLRGEQVIELKDNFGPRLGFNLDPIGDGVDKFYGSYGRYFIPVASNLSYRGADDLHTAYYQGGPVGTVPYNADGTPVGGIGAYAPIISDSFRVCPATAPGRAAGQRACQVFGDGSVEPADAKYAYGTKATNEDEFIVGYERQLGDLWSVGAAVTYRKLNNVSEDIDVGYLVERYCDVQKIAGCSDNNPNVTRLINYIIANPGKDLTFLVQRPLPNGTRPVLTFTAAEAGITPATREYAGIEFTFDREFDGVWSLGGSYVLSESIGNYEGTVLSDNGQPDAGSTILYDHLGLTEGKYGLLPNHRGHQMKLFGSYTLMESLTVGANFSVISPRHFGCLSRSANDTDSFAYGAATGRCRPDIQALAGNRDPFFVYTPFGQGTAALVDTDPEYAAYSRTANRGSVMEADWIYTLDMSFRYTMPTFGFMPDGITLRADVFNVFNSLGVTDLVETGTVAGNAVGGNPNYGLPSSYQTPRSVRFGFDLRF